MPTHLERENADLRRSLQETQEQHIEADRQQRRQRQEAANEELRSAETWPSAFRKYEQILIAEHKAIPKCSDTQGTLDQIDFHLSECRAARLLWREIEASNAAEIVKLNARLQQIQTVIRHTVAAKLRCDFVNGYLADALAEDDTPGDFLETV